MFQKYFRSIDELIKCLKRNDTSITCVLTRMDEWRQESERSCIRVLRVSIDDAASINDYRFNLGMFLTVCCFFSFFILSYIFIFFSISRFTYGGFFIHFILYMHVYISPCKTFPLGNGLITWRHLAGEYFVIVIEYCYTLCICHVLLFKTLMQKCS